MRQRGGEEEEKAEPARRAFDKRAEFLWWVVCSRVSGDMDGPLLVDTPALVAGCHGALGSDSWRVVVGIYGVLSPCSGRY